MCRQLFEVSSVSNLPNPVYITAYNRRFLRGDDGFFICWLKVEMSNAVKIGLIGLLLGTLALAGGQGSWQGYAHLPSRLSIAVDAPTTVDNSTLQWTAWQDPWFNEYYIEFEWPSSCAVYEDSVYAAARYLDANDNHTNNQLIAFNANTGEVRWSKLIEKSYMDSWSSPCVDTAHDTVLIGSGTKVYAFDCNSGTEIWSTSLNKPIVNASVCLALDITPARAFITDYTGYSMGGSLYCINLDPNTPANPYEPGQIVWSDEIGATSGNTPAYADGVTYVGCVKTTDGDVTGGSIGAYDATSITPERLWQTTSEQFNGFFGSVAVARNGFIYAADYSFYGTENNSVLYKFDANDGSVIWMIGTERTSSVPVVVGDMIYISGGLDGYGSRPKVQAYRDNGDTVAMLWETPADMTIGGWTHQPVYAQGRLYVGAIAPGYNFDPYTDLYVLDVTKTPSDTGFVISHFNGAGSSPAVTCDSIYTIGYDGLFKFHQPALLSDVDSDNAVNSDDLAQLAQNWLFNGAVGIERSDLNLDGKVDFFDIALLANQWSEVIN